VVTATRAAPHDGPTRRESADLPVDRERRPMLEDAQRMRDPVVGSI
jgi:hypothetical protein